MNPHWLHSPLKYEKGTGADIRAAIVSGMVLLGGASLLLANFFSLPYEQSQKSLQKLTRSSFLVVAKVGDREKSLNMKLSVSIQPLL